MIEPMLCQRAEWGNFPQGFLWEPKLDGTRSLAHKQGDKIKLMNRRGYDNSTQFPELVDELKKIPHEFVIDGEICSNNFTELAQRSHLQDPFRISLLAKLKPATYWVFDVIELDGQSEIHLPLTERKKVLKNLLNEQMPLPPNEKNGFPIRLLEPETLDVLLGKVERKEIEGLVAKSPFSTYEFKRSSSWLKFRKETTTDLVIIGYEDTDKPTRPFRSLIFNYKGKEVQASSGLSDQDLKLLDEIFVGEPKVKRGTKWYFEKPHLIAEVEFFGGSEMAWRFPKVLRLRLDK